MNCRDKELIPACFTPTTGDPVNVMHVTIFDKDGEIIATYYADEAGVVIDQSTFLGGGTATIGVCSVASGGLISEREICVIIDGVSAVAIGIYEVTSTGTTLLRVENRQGNELTAGVGAGQYTVQDNTLCDCDTPRV